MTDTSSLTCETKRRNIYSGKSEPVILPRNSESLYLLQRIRDESHRFAITYHRQLEKSDERFSP